MKNKYYKDYTSKEIKKGYDFIQWELSYYNCPFFIKKIILKSWRRFKNNEFSFDGATFVKERSSFNKKTPYHLRGTIFESASLVHDDFNSQGKIGFWVDAIFLGIMIFMSYKKSQIIKRTFLMFIGTWINVLRHKFYLKDYKGDLNLKKVINN